MIDELQRKKEGKKRQKGEQEKANWLPPLSAVSGLERSEPSSLVSYHASLWRWTNSPQTMKQNKHFLSLRCLGQNDKKSDQFLQSLQHFTEKFPLVTYPYFKVQEGKVNSLFSLSLTPAPLVYGRGYENICMCRCIYMCMYVEARGQMWVQFNRS